MSEYATERKFNEMGFTHEHYNQLKRRIAELEITVKQQANSYKGYTKKLIAAQATIERVKAETENIERAFECSDSTNREAWTLIHQILHQLNAALQQEQNDV